MSPLKMLLISGQALFAMGALSYGIVVGACGVWVDGYVPIRIRILAYIVGFFGLLTILPKQIIRPRLLLWGYLAFLCVPCVFFSVLAVLSLRNPEELCNSLGGLVLSTCGPLNTMQTLRRNS